MPASCRGALILLRLRRLARPGTRQGACYNPRLGRAAPTERSGAGRRFQGSLQVRQRSGRRTITLFLLALPLLAAAAPDRPTKGASRPEDVRRIELHVGIPGFVYIGQSVTDLVKKFPPASVVPFAGQDDPPMANIAHAGLSCIAVGAPKGIMPPSTGFNPDGVPVGSPQAA